MESIISQLLALVVLSVAIITKHTDAVSVGKPVKTDLKAFCGGTETDVRTANEFAEMIDNGGEDHGCSEYTMQLLSELREIFENKRWCSNDNINAFLGFYDKRIKPAMRDEANPETKLPKALIEFALSYGMLTSYMCKIEMVIEFSSETQMVLSKRFGDEAFKQLQHYFVNQNSLSQLLQPIAKRGEIVLPADLFVAVPELERELVPHLTNSENLAGLRQFCESTLQPLYEPFLLPLARLQKAGFNPGMMEDDKSDMDTFWTTVTFMCELLKPTKETVNTNQADQDVEQDVDQELDQMAKELEPKPEVRLSSQCPAPTDGQSEPVEPYESITRHTGWEHIISAFRGKFVSSLKTFDVDEDDTERVRDLLQERSFRVFKMMARRGNHKPFFKKLARRLVLKKDSEQDWKEAEGGLISLLEAPEPDDELYVKAKKMKIQSDMVISLVLKYSMISAANALPSATAPAA